MRSGAGAAELGCASGRDGVVPFDFACHRCGNCCTGGAGYVWLREGEVERMAARLGLTPEAFAERFVRRVPDPRSGVPVAALREDDASREGGRCLLLEGSNRCSVYEDRPAHCAEFPFWPAVLEEEAAFESARATCPGIAVRPGDEAREGAFRALEELYDEVDAFVRRAEPVCIRRGVCCHFEDAGHELYATALESDYAAARHPDPPPPGGLGRCPYHVEGKCTAREGRPLGCRTYFCDTRTTSVLAEAHEHFLSKLRAIEREHDYPAAYGAFPKMLAARGVGGTSP